jgi:hypothetical protein
VTLGGGKSITNGFSVLLDEEGKYELVVASANIDAHFGSNRDAL